MTYVDRYTLNGASYEKDAKADFIKQYVGDDADAEKAWGDRDKKKKVRHAHGVYRLTLSLVILPLLVILPVF